jgi:hypothetical protein
MRRRKNLAVYSSFEQLLLVVLATSYRQIAPMHMLVLDVDVSGSLILLDVF